MEENKEKVVEQTTKQEQPKEETPKVDLSKFESKDDSDVVKVDLNKKPIGSIVGFHNFGAGDIVEVKPEGSETIFLPFTGFLKQVHIIEKQLVMNIPDGFIN